MKLAKCIWTACLLWALLGLAAPGRTDELSVAQGVKPSAELSFQRSLAGDLSVGLGATSSSSTREIGTPASDSIRGTGTRAGYVLTHGGVIAGSEAVTVDGSLRRRNLDSSLKSS